MSRSNLLILAVLALTALSIWGYTQRPYSLGLDVQGGTRLTYKLDFSKLPADRQERPTEIQDKLVNILSGRASGALAVSEPLVAKKGVDQIIVELPGYTDVQKAKDLIGSTAKIQVFHATNVSTRVTQRRYSVGETEESGGAPFVTFNRRGSDEPLRPGDPGYVEMLEGWRVILEGEDVADAQPQVAGESTQPFFTFTRQGAEKMREWSRRFVNRGEHIAFVLDGRVLSIAPVKDNTILGDNAIIDGTFEPGYVRTLTELIRAGSLPVPLESLGSQKVDPTIGKFALNQMILAGAISFAVVCVFLIAYYALPGFVAMVALILYTLFTITLLKLAGATFSLASIAAFILSVGMAVDANILVFERIKEEIRNGVAIPTAIQRGFNRALASIFDSNACTIITSGVLWIYGSGPVKGFATTLILGVVVSFFTAFIVTRALMEAVLALGLGKTEKAYALNRAWFGEALERGADSRVLHIVENSKRYFLISAIFIVPGLIAVAAGGIKPNVEFRGGYEGQYLVPAGQELQAGKIRADLERAGFPGSNVKFASTETQQIVMVTVPPNDKMRAGDDANNNRILAETVGLSTEGSSFTAIGATISQETVRNAIMGVVISSILIILWLTIRFGIALGGAKNGIKFGISAVLALVHDVLFVVGLAGILGFLLGWEISALFVTAMLTVIGFSVHDTIIIFDRLRENLRRQVKGESFEHLVNKSVTQTIARSINTTMTAVVPLLILIIWGTPTPDLKFMCVTMLGGIAIGAYSSIFNAAPILYLWNRATIKRHGEQAGLLAEAAREAKLRAQQVAMDQMATATTGGSEYGTVKRRSGVAERKVDDED